MRITALLISFFCWFNLLSEQKESLKDKLIEIKRSANDTLKINSLLNIYDSFYSPYKTDSFGQGQKYILEAYRLSESLNYKKGIVESSFRIGQYYKLTGSDDKAVQYLFICLKAAETINDKNRFSAAALYLGIVYYSQKKWDEALSYFLKSEDLFIEGKRRNTASAIYLSGLCYLEKKDFKKAMSYLRNAMLFAKSVNDSDEINESKIGIGRIYAAQNQNVNAMKYFNEALRYYLVRNQKQALCILYCELASIHFKNNKLDSALKMALQAYKFAKTTNGLKFILPETTNLLHKIYFKKGNVIESYKYLLENNNIKDSVFTKDISTQIALASNNYEFEKKEMLFNQKIKDGLRKKNILTALAIAIGVVLIIIFISLVIVRKERKKSDSLLLNILPKETASELKKFGKVISKNHESVSIMFCDVKNFTSISESLSAATLVTILDTYFGKFDEIVSLYFLEKIKTIGDSYMCAGGLHNPNRNHASDCVKAALHMSRLVDELEDETISKFGYAFKFRIGINTGNVVSGVVGSKKYAYDIWGDAVNVAARMEQNSEPGQINISGNTFNLISSLYETTYRGKITAKNKGDLDMYFVNRLPNEINKG